jgi:hypothetical protein
MSSGTCAVADKYTAEEILRAAQVSGSAAPGVLAFMVAGDAR